MIDYDLQCMQYSFYVELIPRDISLCCVCCVQIYRVFGDNQEYETIRLNETLAAYGDDSRVRTFTCDVFTCH